MDINSKYCGLLLTVHLNEILFFLYHLIFFYSIQIRFHFIYKLLPEEVLYKLNLSLIN
jgi:hypothetical protein